MQLPVIFRAAVIAVLVLLTTPAVAEDLEQDLRVRPEVAVCAVHDGALVVRYTQVLKPDQAAVTQ